MSAGICGKRPGFEEIFGSPATSPSSKRSRCCSIYGSPAPNNLDLSFGFEEKIAALLQIFPSMDREVVETVLNSHNLKVDDAIKSLHALCLGNDSAKNELAALNFTQPPNDNSTEGAVNAQASQPNAGDAHNSSLEVEFRSGSDWVEYFVKEMMSASNWDDAQARAVKILQDFEKSVLAHTTKLKEQEIAYFREQLQHMLKENQVLRRAITIQHQRSLEHEEKAKEVQQLKNIISQYHQQVQTLEMTNYALKIHLQRAEEANSIPSQYHPDIF